MDTSTVSTRSASSALRTRSQGPRRPKTAANGTAPPQKPQRSNSATRLQVEQKLRSQAEDARKREQADAAFVEWLKRKLNAPREPRCSPSRSVF
ncbi:unnamed protein product, partial [Mesorhabditis spiculigera]